LVPYICTAISALGLWRKLSVSCDFKEPK